MKYKDYKDTTLFGFITDELVASVDDLNRFPKSKTIKSENISSHSWWVIMCTDLLLEVVFPLQSPLFKLRVLRYALFHDFTETITGDIDHLVKYNSYNGINIRREIDAYEKHVLDSFSGLFDKIKPAVEYDDEVGKQIVKVADWMSCIKFMYSEYMLGNKFVLIESANMYFKEAIDKSIDATKNLITMAQRTDPVYNPKAQTTELFQLMKDLQQLKTLR